MRTLPQRVIENLGFYVYLYVDPRSGYSFYVGKGQGDRILCHLSDTEDTEKVRLIAELREVGLEPRLEILKYGLTEQEAFLVESAAIDLLGIHELTNRVKGHGAMENGRASLAEIIRELDAEDAQITEKVVLIKAAQLYRQEMTPSELYEATRGIWRVVPRRHKADYAFCVYRGIVREVYAIERWRRADDPPFRRADILENDPRLKNRWLFDGTVAEEMRKKYLGKSVRSYLGSKSQNPIKYVNC
jgi:hypothetical protein